MKTNIYIDGFNFYYGCIKNTPYKWLDVSVLCKILLPKDTINQIKYFTALVTSRPNDPNQAIRQTTYIRALETIPNLSVIYGQFLSSVVKRRLASPVSGLPSFVDVLKSEEKGSDVNLATHMLIDGFKNDYDLAIVVSNDSDLTLPVRMVRSELGKKVGVINPHKYPSKELQREATFLKSIRKSALKRSQFPTNLSDSNGQFHKPSTW